MTETADSRCTMCSVQVRAGSKIRRRGELFESCRGSFEKIHPIKNSVSGSCVETSCNTELQKGVCTDVSTENEEAGREPIFVETS